MAGDTTRFSCISSSGVKRHLGFVIVITLLALLCGCNPRKQFDRDMQDRYEKQCDKYFAVYVTSDIEGAKKALRDTIDLSLAERSKARYYWRFNLMVADSQARLAIIAERQGDTNEADRLFTSASDYMVIQQVAYRQEMRRYNNGKITAEDAHPIVRMTPQQWRNWIGALEKQYNIKWR